MPNEVHLKAGQSLSRLVPKMSVAGDGLMARMRTVWFGALGMTTAVGLGLVAFVLNQGLPSIQELPFPNAPAELGVAQNEQISPRADAASSRHDRGRRSSLPPPGRRQSLPQAPTEAKIVESQAIAAAPAPEPIPNAPPPPPPSGGQGSNPQASQPPQPPSSTPAASKNVPKGKGVGWSRAPGKTKKASEPVLTLPPQVGPDSQEDEDEEEEAKEMGDHAEKHAGKSDRGHQ